MFEIDIVTLSFAMLCLIAFVIPFYLNSKKSKKEKLQKETKLEEYLRSQNLKLDQREMWRNQYFIGLDSNQRKLVYIQNLKDFQPLLLNLDEINHVAQHEVSRMIGTEKNQRKVLDELYLHLIGKNGKVKASLEIYNGEIFSDLSGEPVLIQKWEAVIKEELRNYKLAEKV